MTAPRVGIIGASGAVGAAAARTLVGTRSVRLRLGVRRRDRAPTVGAAAEIVTVDVNDGAALERFCADCRVVVNCAGPSYRILDRVARAALAAGADYVDPGGDEPVERRLVGTPAAAGRTVLLSAGLMPGVSALLPRWLAHRFDVSHRLTAYVCLRDHLTPAGAADYLLTLGHGFGESLAAWRGGARVSRALEPLTQVALPFFAAPVNAHPFLSRETERLAARLKLREVSWYNVFDGPHMMTALSRHQGAMRGEDDLDEAAAALVRAANLDLFGSRPYQMFVLRLDGFAGERAITRTAVLRTADAYLATAAVVVAAVIQVLESNLAPGVYFTGDVLDPGVVEQLRGPPVSARLQVVDGCAAVEEGAL